ncbi:hypothetical protein FA95DRAFT_1533557 [Auriscalpium vulgare]|uniref:Uncharacterized protein n=1 Tax=Auriscalpium vulgare TaxID=40419 RepID=A0ACB8S615_9AGAM|nr:hypothetical protein FA95DRAFT_1533557 [Auriscalpium vulgare]
MPVSTTVPVTPDEYKPGATIAVDIDDEDVTVTVVRACMPFTVSQVLIVRTSEPTPTSIDPTPTSILPPNKLVALKIYDPRFTGRRGEKKDGLPVCYPWSAENEAKAASRRQWWQKRDLDSTDAVDGEEYYWREQEDSQLSEVKTYEHLESLQGAGVPRLLGYGYLRCGPSPRRSVVPPVVFLEYIPDATRIYDIDPQLLTPSLVRSLIETVSAFEGLDVSHGDLNAGNVLLSPAKRPTRAVVADFGYAAWREAYEEDADWRKELARRDDVGSLRRLLRNTLGMDDDELSHFASAPDS